MKVHRAVRQLSADFDADSRTEISEKTLTAEGQSRPADTTAMKNELMGKLNPTRLRNKFLKIFFDFDRSLRPRPSETTAEASHMRINDDPAGDPKSVPQDDVRRFPTDARQFDELFQGPRHFATMLSHQRVCKRAEVLRFGRKVIH